MINKQKALQVSATTPLAETDINPLFERKSKAPGS